jgi:esterase
MELYYREYGAGTPLIILHGLFGSLDNWRITSEELGCRFNVFAVDQRNHGRSPHAREMNYGLMAKDIHEFMTRKKMNSATLLGHSMGGKTAMKFASLYPEKVDGLIVVDILPTGNSRQQISEVVTALKLFKLKNVLTHKDAETQMAPYIKDLPVRKFLVRNLGRNEKGFLDWQCNLDGILENYGNICQEIPRFTFRKPCLFIRGECSDYVVDAEWQKMKKKYFDRAELVTISGAGHFVHVENPEAFLTAVVEFISNLN